MATSIETYQKAAEFEIYFKYKHLNAMDLGHLLQQIGYLHGRLVQYSYELDNLKLVRSRYPDQLLIIESIQLGESIRIRGVESWVPKLKFKPKINSDDEELVLELNKTLKRAVIITTIIGGTVTAGIISANAILNLHDRLSPEQDSIINEKVGLKEDINNLKRQISTLERNQKKLLENDMRHIKNALKRMGVDELRINDKRIQNPEW